MAILDARFVHPKYSHGDSLGVRFKHFCILNSPQVSICISDKGSTLRIENNIVKYQQSKGGCTVTANPSSGLTDVKQMTLFVGNHMFRIETDKGVYQFCDACVFDLTRTGATLHVKLAENTCHALFGWSCDGKGECIHGHIFLLLELSLEFIPRR